MFLLAVFVLAVFVLAVFVLEANCVSGILSLWGIVSLSLHASALKCPSPFAY